MFGLFFFLNFCDQCYFFFVSIFALTVLCFYYLLRFFWYYLIFFFISHFLYYLVFFSSIYFYSLCLYSYYIHKDSFNIRYVFSIHMIISYFVAVLFYFQLNSRFWVKVIFWKNIRKVFVPPIPVLPVVERMSLSEGVLELLKFLIGWY